MINIHNSTLLSILTAADRHRTGHPGHRFAGTKQVQLQNRRGKPPTAYTQIALDKIVDRANTVLRTKDKRKAHRTLCVLLPVTITRERETKEALKIKSRT